MTRSNVRKRGVLLVNLGSPASTEIADVRAYLDEFLMDPEVIDSPWPVRALVVKAFILPFRPKRTAAAYREIWQPDGSPLLIFSRQLRDAVAERIDQPVALAMRYGEPSIRRAIETLVGDDLLGDGLLGDGLLGDGLLGDGIEELLLMPLYPQHAASTRTTTIAKVRELLREIAPSVALRILPPFYDLAAYRRVLVASIREVLPERFDRLLFSYHGLPERHIQRADPTGSHCLKRPDCCTTPSQAHASCYRHQAFALSDAVARALGLQARDWQVSFQSRLGRLPWLSPYTDQVLAELPGQGVRKLVVACPAFVADNLETLEEIDLRGRETFLAAGGEEFTLVPCLNARPDWVEVVASWCIDPPPQVAFDGAR